ncbi:hypothetical protein BGZ52_001528 [Haplosporangium bisporale]|nr:hypothetical protein BGZ52_001528 [Haplosporangium bisporale]KAF9202191.1 hypothetical protein BGZ59_002280 [Podila verticillata]
MTSQDPVDQYQPYAHNSQYGPTEQAYLHSDHGEEQGQDRLSSQPLNLDLLPTSHASWPYYPGLTPPGKILALQTLTTLSTIVFTVIPVVIKAGPEISWGHWYSWKDALRLIEPFCSGLLHFWFFYASDLMRPEWSLPQTMKVVQEQVYGSSTSRATSQSMQRMLGSKHQDIALSESTTPPGSDMDAEYGVGLGRSHPQQQHTSVQRRTGLKHSAAFKSTLSAVFMFFLIVYATGAALHTAAAFFKATIELFLDNHSRGIGLSTHPLTNGTGEQLSLALAQELKQGYMLMQDEWEHTISHYMYAFGALGMSWCEMVAYSGQILPQGVSLAKAGHLKAMAATQGPVPEKSSKRLVALWILAGVLYGGIVAGVACQYPKGLYVGLAYLGVLLSVLILYLGSRPKAKRGLFSLGRYYILQTYLIGGVVALVAIIIYMAKNKFDMLTSNDKSHLGSTTRP